MRSSRSTGVQRLSAHTSWVIAGIEEACQYDTFTDCQSDVSRGDVASRIGQADGHRCIQWRETIEMVYSIGERFDGAKGAESSCMVHGASSLSILLVVKIESYRVGGS